MIPISLALITGASSGLGKALCFHAAKKKIPLLITGRRLDLLETLAHELRKTVPVTCHAADLADPEQRKGLIALIRILAPSLVINNAGFGLYGNALNHPISSQMEMLEVNCNAVLEISLEAAQALIKQNKKGIILNVASVAAFFDYPSLSVYAASKRFVTQFSLSFDQEVSPFGVRVLAACPGQIVTPFRERASGGTPQTKNWLTMSAEKAARIIFSQIKKRKPLLVFDWRYRLGLFLSHFVSKKYLQQKLQKAIEK